MTNGRNDHTAPPQPFRNGFPGAAVLDRLCETPLTAEAAPVGWQRASVREDGGSIGKDGDKFIGGGESGIGVQWP